MSNVGYSQVDAFLNEIAKTLNYDRDSLSLTCQVITSGPTAQPGNPTEAFDPIKASPGTCFPSAHYDELGHRHMEFRVIREIKSGSGKTVVPHTLFFFQHHPMPGCCRMAVNRWVRIQDSNPWPTSLKKEALRFRARVARKASCSLLLITTGDSFRGDELYDEFDLIEEIASSCGTNKVYSLDVRSYV